ncbi:neck protein [uncultured Mediterranean phage]|nr:neck protein [uncultured Mediterranean phage]
MAVNSAFHTNNLQSLATERSLYQNLIKEAIQIYGHDVYYVNRTTVAIDNILGEDSISKFTRQHPIEMYVEDSEGFGGDKEIITQFGLENRNEITFVVSKERFQEMDSQVTLEDGTDTTGGSILLETASIDQSSSSSTLTTIQGDNNFYILLDITPTDADRPLEGDLVYHPVFEKIFEINFVDHDEPFYQLDNNPVYKLRCKSFEYGSEVLDTGITTIDAIETDLTTDTREHQFTLEQTSAYNESIALEFNTNLTYTDSLLMEDDDVVVHEDDSSSIGTNILLENAADTGDDAYLIQETYIIGDADTDKTAQNELFDTLDDTVLDFSETNPFGDAGSL